MYLISPMLPSQTNFTFVFLLSSKPNIKHLSSSESFSRNQGCFLRPYFPTASSWIKTDCCGPNVTPGIRCLILFWSFEVRILPTFDWLNFHGIIFQSHPSAGHLNRSLFLHAIAKNVWGFFIGIL